MNASACTNAINIEPHDVAAGLDMDRIMVTNMDADAQVPSLYVQEVDHAAAAAEDPHLLVGTHGILSMHLLSEIQDHADHARVFPNLNLLHNSNCWS